MRERDRKRRPLEGGGNDGRERGRENQMPICMWLPPWLRHQGRHRFSQLSLCRPTHRILRVTG
ncbi:hypothetical protein HanPI659440_Chr04g0175661 [Helianthus annuus]|nr:hypothetical protein HanPI659440_Chr04g0175661 [Helianthus annuus]